MHELLDTIEAPMSENSYMDCWFGAQKTDK